MELATLTIETLIEALWFILPAYAANSVPVDVSQIPFLKKYGKPIDGGRMLWGNRILGDGKTWRGLISGLIAGTLVGYIETIFQATLQTNHANLPEMTVSLAFILSAGTLTGDMAASFIKRRTRLKPGDPAPLLDQLDFVVGAFLFAWLATAITTTDYSINSLWKLITPLQLGTIILLTPFIHLLGNGIAYIWKLKKTPW